MKAITHTRRGVKATTTFKSYEQAILPAKGKPGVNFQMVIREN
jgi:hypothetical protein